MVAEKIAEYYKLPSEKVKILGLLHDCAKDYSVDELKKLINKYNIRLDKVGDKIPKIWHAYVGAELAKEVFQINDEEMLDAIRYHSTASDKLSLIGKIIYIADKIEPDRGSKKIKKLWELLKQDIDLAMLELINQELKYLISKNSIIHPDTLVARNKIIIDRK
jgi:nicotinate-nucleotide adenylyltransferase